MVFRCPPLGIGKSINWLACSQNSSWWKNISRCGLLFQWTSSIKIQLIVMVKYRKSFQGTFHKTFCFVLHVEHCDIIYILKYEGGTILNCLPFVGIRVHPLVFFFFFFFFFYSYLIHCVVFWFCFCFLYSYCVVCCVSLDCPL